MARSVAADNNNQWYMCEKHHQEALEMRAWAEEELAENGPSERTQSILSCRIELLDKKNSK